MSSIQNCTKNKNCSKPKTANSTYESPLRNFSFSTFLKMIFDRNMLNLGKTTSY